MGRQLDETLSIPTSVLPWSRSSQLSSDQSAPKRLPSSSPRLNLSTPPQSHSSNNSPSSRPLVWSLIRALPGNPFGSHYQAYSRQRYPRQYYIVTRMATHHGIIVPSMEYLSSRKTRILQRTYVVVPITHGNPLPHAPHSGSRGRRLTLGSTYQSDGFPMTLPCSPSDSGRSAASTAST